MKIGLDLDGTIYTYPEFFKELIETFTTHGHEFFCTSSHSIHEWPSDCIRLEKLGINSSLISPLMMYETRHGDIKKKALQADALDIVFDDDSRIQQFTNTPIFCIPTMKKHNYTCD